MTTGEAAGTHGGNGTGSGSAADPAGLLASLQVDLPAELVVMALTHRSYAYEHGGLPTNERLEFLGDSVLGVVVTDALYRRHPEMSEGQLAKLRAAVVNMRALAGVGRELGLGAYLLLGRGEEASGGRDKSSILADTVEALLGAVYYEHGTDVARALVHRLVDPLLESSARLGAGLDWKTSLQELTASSSRGVPEYRVTEEGPDHAKLFHASALVQGEARGTGSGRSKKEAEQAAAAAAFGSLTEELAAQSAANGAADGTVDAADAVDAAADGVQPA
ncbi:ribonuclease III [Spongisporangium articulatum]|uniref:Ribonuclease 3 n=1 Tax=Spongisporangium articulatum TaxID=3362603 RepID=A0ABW8AQ54_9ACTN